MANCFDDGGDEPADKNADDDGVVGVGLVSAAVDEMASEAEDVCPVELWVKVEDTNYTNLVAFSTAVCVGGCLDLV